MTTNYPHTPPPPARENGLGTTALVFGIIGLLFAFIPIIGVIAWPLVILGLIFAVLGLIKVSSGRADNKGTAIAGAVTSGLGLMVCFAWVLGIAANMPSTTSGSSTSTVAAAAPSLSTLGAAPATNNQPAAFPGATSQDVVQQAGSPANLDGVTVVAGPLRPGDGVLGHTVCTPVSYQNSQSTPVSFNLLFDWKLQDPNGAITSATVFGSKHMLQSGQIAPGGQTSGDVCFDASNGSPSGQYVVLYDPTFRFTSERIAWLNAR
jgi:hypothetical protein